MEDNRDAQWKHHCFVDKRGSGRQEGAGCPALGWVTPAPHWQCCQQLGTGSTDSVHIAIHFSPKPCGQGLGRNPKAAPLSHPHTEPGQTAPIPGSASCEGIVFNCRVTVGTLASPLRSVFCIGINRSGPISDFQIYSPLVPPASLGLEESPLSWVCPQGQGGALLRGVWGRWQGQVPPPHCSVLPVAAWGWGLLVRAGGTP